MCHESATCFLKKGVVTAHFPVQFALLAQFMLFEHIPSGIERQFPTLYASVETLLGKHDLHVISMTTCDNLRLGLG